MTTSEPPGSPGQPESPGPPAISRSVSTPIDVGLASDVKHPSFMVEEKKESDKPETPPLPSASTVLQALLRDMLPRGPSAAELSLRCEIRVDPSGQNPRGASVPKGEKLERTITGVDRAAGAGAGGKSAPVLALLRRLRRLSSSFPAQGNGLPTASAASSSGRSDELQPTAMCWENGPLNRKLADQLARPLIATGGVAPPWVEALPLAYPFLFQRKLREQLLHCAGFGTSHAVLWLQRQSVEARYGTQLRATERNQDARRELLNERILSDQSVFIGPARSDLVTLASRTPDLLKNAERVIELTYSSKALLEVKFADEGFGDGVTQSFYTDVAAEMTALDGEGASCALTLWVEHGVDSEMRYQDRRYLHSRRGLFPQPHPPGSASAQDACRLFRFLGRLMAKALRDGFIVPLPLCNHFFAAVLNEDLPLSALPQPTDGWNGGIVGVLANFAADLRSRLQKDGVDRAKAMKEAAEEPGWPAKWLQDTSASKDFSFQQYVETIDVNFVACGNNGQELCDGGSKRALTIENLEAFAELAATWWLKDGIKDQAAAFRQGVQDVCTSSAIWAFEAAELRALFCGNDRVEWTAEELAKHLRLRGGYKISSPPVEMLIAELVRMPPERRGHFLEFVTACPRLPQGGLAAAEIVILPAQKKGSFPHARTCTKELHLPEYDSSEQLSAKLSEAIDSAKGLYDDH